VKILIFLKLNKKKFFQKNVKILIFLKLNKKKIFKKRENFNIFQFQKFFLFKNADFSNFSNFFKK